MDQNSVGRLPRLLDRLRLRLGCALGPDLTIHYHGTPITPLTALYELAGRHFCVSFAQDQDVRRAHDIGQSVMLDNGAFSMWQQNKPTDWPAYYEWAEQWLEYPTTWAVIPDVIDGPENVQNELLKQWPYKHKGAPVWHMNESIPRLLHLLDTWPRVCIGSTSIYVDVMSDPWKRRMDDVFDFVVRHHVFMPWIHMLRGMQCSGERWPFASLDSTDVGRNHNRLQNSPSKLADRWDCVQCSPYWNSFPPRQLDLLT